MDENYQRSKETLGLIYARGNGIQDIPGNTQRTNQEKLQTEKKKWRVRSLWWKWA